MKRTAKYLIGALAFMMILTLVCSTAGAGKYWGPRAKNVIFLVPDGMGISNVTAARIFKNGPDGDPLHFETLRHIGYQRTHSKDSTVTDSAAAASAWACGEKFNNGEISCHDDDFDGTCDSESVPTILELAKAMGKSTGLVATSDITHATPAVWGAHVHNRKCEEEIARQFMFRTEVDVLLGGGIAGNRSPCQLTHSNSDFLESLLDEAAYAGYAVVGTRDEMETAVSGGASKILGVFGSGGKTQERFRVDPAADYPDEEPTLAEMTQSALDILEKNKRGFFFMMEGSQIDWADHANDVEGQVAETLGFDAAVKVVLDWLDEKPRRKHQTLVIVVPDHDCAGFAINGPYGTLSEAGEIVEGGWTSGSHTAEDTLIWSQGPGSWLLDKAVDNTDLYDVMQNVMR